MKSTLKSSKTLTILGCLLSASLAGCLAEQPCLDGVCEPDENPSADELFRLEIEVIGAGDVFVATAEPQRCPPERALCSLLVPAGTRIELSAEFQIATETGWEEDCRGHEVCSLVVHDDVFVVANFTDQATHPDPAPPAGPLLGRDLEQARLPGTPGTIVDPVGGTGRTGARQMAPGGWKFHGELR